MTYDDAVRIRTLQLNGKPVNRQLLELAIETIKAGAPQHVRLQERVVLVSIPGPAADQYAGEEAR